MLPIFQYCELSRTVPPWISLLLRNQLRRTIRWRSSTNSEKTVQNWSWRKTKVAWNFFCCFFSLFQGYQKLRDMSLFEFCCKYFFRCRRALICKIKLVPRKNVSLNTLVFVSSQTLLKPLQTLKNRFYWKEQLRFQPALQTTAYLWIKSILFAQESFYFCINLHSFLNFAWTTKINFKFCLNSKDKF